LFPDPLNNGFLSYHTLIIFTLIVIITITPLITWFVCDISSIRKIALIFLISSVTGFSVWGGYQLGAPSYSFENKSLSRNQEKINFSHFQEESGILFEFKSCQASGSRVTCTVKLTNKDLDKRIYFNKYTSFQDDLGNVLRVKSFKIGNQNFGSKGTRTIVSNTSNIINIDFDGLHNNSKKLSLLILIMSYDDKEVQVKFRNFLIERSIY
jgi:hypothetical protein